MKGLDWWSIEGEQLYNENIFLSHIYWKYVSKNKAESLAVIELDSWSQDQSWDELPTSPRHVTTSLGLICLSNSDSWRTHPLRFRNLESDKVRRKFQKYTLWFGERRKSGAGSCRRPQWDWTRKGPIQRHYNHRPAKEKIGVTGSRCKEFRDQSPSFFRKGKLELINLNLLFLHLKPLKGFLVPLEQV